MHCSRRSWYIRRFAGPLIELQRRFGYKSFYTHVNIWGTKSIERETRSLCGKTNEHGQSITRSDSSVTVCTDFDQLAVSQVSEFLFCFHVTPFLCQLSLLDQSMSQSDTPRRTLSGQSIDWSMNLLTNQSWVPAHMARGHLPLERPIFSQWHLKILAKVY